MGDYLVAEAHGGPIAVTGASGFVGSHLVRALRGNQIPVRAVIRNTGAAASLRALGCEVVLADVRNRRSLEDAFLGCQAVVHLVAVIREWKDVTYEAINRQGTTNVVGAALQAGVGRLVHMSALGAHPSGPRYLRSKWDGEEEVRRGGMRYVIFRPSFIIGSGEWSMPPGRGAAAQFADVVRLGIWYPLKLLLGWERPFSLLATVTPLVPVLGSGRYRSMPVAIGDLLDAVRQALGRDDVLGESYDIGGPDVLTYDEILDEVARALHLRRWKVHLPLPAARPLVRGLALMPHPPITRDEFESLLADNLCDNTKVVQTFRLSLRPFSIAIRDALQTR